MARSYKRDARGRFAGGGGGSGGGGKRPAAKPVSRGTNRLTRDNAGKITGTGNGATARGGRLKTASGKQRATQTAKATGGSRAGTIKGRVTRNPQAGARLAAARKGKVAPKVDVSLKGVAARRARANAPRTSMYIKQQMIHRSLVTRSAANAIYNRQRRVGKTLGESMMMVRAPAAGMPGTSGRKQESAAQIREAARKRVIGGRRR